MRIIEQTAKLTPALVITVVATICFLMQWYFEAETFRHISLILTQVSLFLLAVSCGAIALRLQRQHGTSVLAHRVKIFFFLLTIVCTLFVSLYMMTSVEVRFGINLETIRDSVRNVVIAFLCGVAVKAMRVAVSVINDTDLEDERIADGRLRR